MKSNLIFVVLALLYLNSCFGQYVLVFTGNACMNNVCDFDNANNWAYGSTKRDELGAPASPALQTGPFIIEIPGSLASQPLLLKTNTSNPTGYHLEEINLRPAASTKRNTEESSSVFGVATGITVLIRNTKLFGFKNYYLGDPLNYQHTLIFENVEVHPKETGESTVHCQQRQSSVVIVNGTTVLDVPCELTLDRSDTFILGENAKLNANAYGANVMSFQGSGKTGNVVRLHGTVSSSYNTIKLNEEAGDNILYLTGANITCFTELTLSNVIIGESLDDSGKTTTVYSVAKKPKVFIGKSQLVHIGANYFAGSFDVDEESMLFIENYYLDYTYYSDGTAIRAKGKSSVYVKPEARLSTVTKKKEVDGGPSTFYFFSYDGLLQFESDIVVQTGYPVFATFNATSKLIFNGNFNDEYGYANFEFAPGSTVTFNKNLTHHQYETSLPGLGVNFIFGDGAIVDYGKLNVTNGSVTLNGATVTVDGVLLQDSELTGHGNIATNVTFSGSSSLYLNTVGKTLEVDGYMIIPGSTSFKVAANSNDCAKLVVNGKLTISSNSAFELEYTGAAPTQDKTYVVATYTTFEGSVPESPNPALYHVELDTVNKQIKVTYIAPPVAPTSEPSAPTDTPSAPSNSPTNSNNPSGADSIKFTPFLFALLMIILMIVKFT